MKQIPAAVLVAVLAILATPAHAAPPERYTVERAGVSLYDAPGDDVRPRIVGTVTAADAASVTLSGGARVPATGAQPGDLATFACRTIDDGTPPTSRDCVLIRAQHPDATAAGTLW